MSDRYLESKRSRARLFYAYKGQCGICGDPLPEDWHADHTEPHGEGGKTTIHNMQPTCPNCNLKKSDSTMELRRFQSDLNAIIERKIQGGLQQVDSILAHVVPGGGKSLLPPIISKYVHYLNGKLCWIVPRVKLMQQGAKDFQKPWARRLVGHSGEMREATNEPDPTRGKIGFITTYQALGRAPELHREEFDQHDYVLFCDEIHHVSRDSKWHRALAPLVRKAELKVFGTGSIERGDREPIAFLPYAKDTLGDGHPGNGRSESGQQKDGYVVDASGRRNWRSIRYRRSEAISDGAILPLNFRILDGTAEWIDEDGNQRQTDSLANLNQEDARAALDTFLRTQAAHEILDSAIADWEKTKKSYRPARLLIAAPDRQHARKYKEYISGEHGHDVGLAIVDDRGQNQEALTQIDRFDPQKSDGPDVGVLVTVAMAYEGLSIKPITHIACLTQYRTKAWLKQLFDRGNRVADGKPQPVIYGPDDPFFERCRAQIAREQEKAVPPEKMWEEEVCRNEGPEQPSGTGGAEEGGIVPIDSSVLRERGIWNGDEFGYRQIAEIKQKMADLEMEEENPAKVAALLAELGFDLGDLENGEPESTASTASVTTSAASANTGDSGSGENLCARGTSGTETTTVKEREESLKDRIDTRIGRWAWQQPGDTGQNKQRANGEVKALFGPRSKLSEEELKECWKHVRKRYLLR